MTDEVSWTATRLLKGQTMARHGAGYMLSVAHVDRRIDSYLAGVVVRGVFIYTGLHPTLSDARRTCEQKLKELK